MAAYAVHQIVPTLADEERARADLYGLLARLWRGAPDAALLRALAAQADDRLQPAGPVAAAAHTVRAGLDDAWAALCAAAAHASAERVAGEYGTVFGGVGRPEVFLHGSYYLSGFLHERPLAELRADLARLGLARQPDQPDTEDHVALLCETMRFLILSPEPALAAMPVQRDFFHAHLASWADAFADAVQASANTDFYKHVAQVTRAFFDVERQAFDIE